MAQKFSHFHRPPQPSLEAMLARVIRTQAESGEHVLAPACLLLLLFQLLYLAVIYLLAGDRIQIR